MTKGSSKSNKNNKSMTSHDNFRIIVTDDLALAKYIISSKYSKIYGDIKIIDDPFNSRYLFTSKSFLLDKTKNQNKHCFVCKCIDSLIKNEEYWESILSGSFLNGHVLVYICEKLDMRSKLAKKFKQYIFSIKSNSVDISSISDEFLKLSKDRRDLLFYLCNKNVTKFISEFNKLVAYSNSIKRQDDLDAVFDEMRLTNLFANLIQDDMFELSEYIMTQQKSKVYKYLFNLQKTEFDFGLLSILYNNFRNLYIYGCANKLNVLQSINMSSFIQNNMKRYISYYNSKQILGILSFLQDLDYKIKSGKVSSEYALDYLLCGVLL